MAKRVKKIKRICLWCGKSFTVHPCLVKQGGGKYCSRQCYYNARGDKDIKKFCQVCGKEIIICAGHAKRGSGKYCSRACFEKAHKRKIIKRICKVCGKEFETTPYQVRKGHGIFCSRLCANKAQNKRIKRICEICGNEFYVISSRVKKGGGNYCSQKCQHKAITKKIKKLCLVCGKEFKVVPSQSKQGKGKFCSRSCARKAQKMPMHHTKPELIFEGICQRNDLPFRYVGDGQLWIGKKTEAQLNPDFIECNGKKIVVEIFGDYWHSPLFNRNIKKQGTLAYRKKHYRRFKWTPIFIWERDLKRKDAEAFVLNKLKVYI